MTWVATPPPGALPHPPSRAAGRYTGPPSYAAPPRWGFPALVWRWPTSVPGTPTGEVSLVERVRVIARTTTAMLWALTIVGVVAAGAEVWRYVLLLQSRYGALSRGTVSMSDTLVVAGSVLAIAVAVLAAGMTLWWLHVARKAAAELAGHEPGRRDRHMWIGLAAPGVNLAVAGSVLAELEHAVLQRSELKRPKPSRLVLGWWVAWVVSGLLFALTVVWRFRTGVQALADGVVLHAVTNLSAAVLAGVTAVVVRRLTTLLAPLDPASVRRMRVIRVTGAPAPELRAVRPAGSVR